MGFASNSQLEVLGKKMKVPPKAWRVLGESQTLIVAIQNLWNVQGPFDNSIKLWCGGCHCSLRCTLMCMFHYNPSAIPVPLWLNVAWNPSKKVCGHDATRRPKRKRKGNPRRSPQSQGPRDNPAWIARPPLRENFVSSLHAALIHRGFKNPWRDFIFLQTAICSWHVAAEFAFCQCATQDVLEGERRGSCAESCFKQNRRNAESKAGSKQAKKQGQGKQRNIGRKSKSSNGNHNNSNNSDKTDDYNNNTVRIIVIIYNHNSDNRW